MLKIYGAKAIHPELKGVIRDIRVLWMAEELKIPYEHIVIDPAKGETKQESYLKLNPFGKVPTIIDEDFVLFESGAITFYLAEKYGKLMPTEGEARALCQQWAFCAVTNIEPQAGRIFGADHFMEKGTVASEVRKMAIGVLERFLPTLQNMFSKQQFIANNEFSVADILLVTSLRSIFKTEVLNPYPAVKSYMERLMARPAFQVADKKNGG